MKEKVFKTRADTIPAEMFEGVLWIVDELTLLC